MKKAIFLDLSTIHPEDISLAPLEDLPLTWSWHDTTRPDELHQRIRNANIIVSNKCPLDSEAISWAGRLTCIVAAATGFNHIDIAAAREANITVMNVPGYATASVVEHVYALILALATRLVDYHAAVRRGDWHRSNNFCLYDYPVSEIKGRRLGIIGYGELGRAVAAIAPSFGMEVLVAESLLGGTGEDRVPLDELLRRADIISIHLPLTDQTRDLIGEKELALMKPDAWLINTARGGIVDETALAEALRQGLIGGAGVDVLAMEPPAQDNPLLGQELPNLVVTPHTAWASRQARQRLVDGLARNIEAFLAGDSRNRVA